MRCQALVLGGACVAFPLAILGCTLVAPLDGLTGGEPDAARAPTGDASTLDSGAAADALTVDSSVRDSAAPASETGTPPAEASVFDANEVGADDSPSDGAGDVVSEPTPPSPIAFVQIAASSPPGFVPSVTTALLQAQTAGDLDVVAIGWNDATSTISEVTDTSGNAYALAVGPTRLGSDLSQSLYYATNIHSAAAGANSVTVTFVQPANVVDLRVVEYSGLDPVAPLDQTDTGAGTSSGPATTGSVTTTTARELLFAAGMSTDLYSGAGAGFSMRLVSSDGDAVEDRTVSATGLYSATATVAASCGWVIQLATFH
ncbi:MAG TPA: hypothetical protein VGL81_33500 [Polyangiaceae bacterium]|jgi:hypothetical protein